jgi:hypothetical protein
LACGVNILEIVEGGLTGFCITGTVVQNVVEGVVWEAAWADVLILGDIRSKTPQAAK